MKKIVHPEVSKYMSGIAKKKKPLSKKKYQEMQKKSVIARLKNKRKKLSTPRLTK